MMIRRLSQLIFGLALYGLAGALMVRGDLGLSPWNVFHQGLERSTGLSFGTATLLTGMVLLLSWIPLKQRIGVGTVLNVLIIGPSADLALMILPDVHDMSLRWILMLGGTILTGVATGIYIGAGLEPGPRDGLMTSICRRTGWSIRVTRTGIEVAALAIGILLGGGFGVGTLVYAAIIGPLVHFFMPRFEWQRPAVPAAAHN
ncbi:hypothetical protein ASE00_13055 [Sphingomonas sp. Root710]|uniref:membrane protein YczE n=1 Tax=Sphingomonas sp. Root710 TaxID=1736594 RepID=UPI0006FA1B03|nr:membrane protein [Sphingomonas sp. Root710]KRB82920.1 hypothetical protein ASE00_13055 [Sphingomonas sp. Root710]